MNLALSDEQVFLREAARGALSRFKTFEAAREALDGKDALPDRWPTAMEAGWPGLLIDDAHGGAGLDVFDAMLVLGECGRVLAGVALLGHLPAPALLGPAHRARSSPGRRRPPTCSSSSPPASAARRTCPSARPMTCTSSGASTPPAGSSARRPRQRRAGARRGA